MFVWYIARESRNVNVLMAGVMLEHDGDSYGTVGISNTSA